MIRGISFSPLAFTSKCESPPLARMGEEEKP